MTELETITSFLPLSDNVGTAGQPRAEQFATIAAAGYEVVVNLAMPTSPGFLANERELVEAQGMEYVAIPVDWDAPKRTDAEKFFATMKARRAKKVFVHCALNMRASAFMYLYRVLHEGIDVARAESDMQRIWTPDGVWAQFIRSTLDAPTLDANP